MNGMRAQDEVPPSGNLLKERATTIETLLDFRDPLKAKRLVIKIGSALLVDGDGNVRRTWLETIATEIRTARERGQEVVVVCSGSVALGSAMLRFPGGGRTSLSHAQASAAVGQIALAGQWADLLRKHRLVAAQLLLTLDDLEGRRRYLNASATIRQLLKEGVVPIVNENDSIATTEIRFGDNDRLAARVAQACAADGILLLTDVDGLYTKHPAQPGAERLPMVRGVTDEMHDMAGGGSGSGMGSGGMTSKLLAAQIAERAGIALAIINGTPSYPIGHAMAAETGTLFLPRRDDNAYKSWIGGRLRFNGALVIDDGCVSALQSGKSLLAAGISDVTGNFARGDIVSVQDTGGKLVAKGLVEYDIEDCRAIMGLQSSEQERVLGHAPRTAVIHRDHMVLT